MNKNTECNHPLTHIAAKHKHFTDKCPVSTYHIKHVLTEIYGPLFNHLRDEPIKLLEIGVRWGGSLAMWREFFPKAQIYGVDVDLSQATQKGMERTGQAKYKDIENTLEVLKGVKMIQGDGYNKDFAEKHFKDMKFDIIIDDGMHDEPSLIKYFNVYRHFLKKGGYLMSEDINSMDLARAVINNFDGPINNMSIIDRMHCSPRGRAERLIMYKDY